MKEPEMAKIASLIADALRSREDEDRLAKVKESVVDLCRAHPIHLD
jgi:glycine/serine hydroxymethyltransferase